VLAAALVATQVEMLADIFAFTMQATQLFNQPAASIKPRLTPCPASG
jgi:hypothetical protein